MSLHSMFSTLTRGTLRSGDNSVEQIPEVMHDLANGSAVLVFDERARESGAVDLVENTLLEASARHRLTLVGTTGDDRDSIGDIREALRLLDGALIVTVGAGSTIDLGKLAAAAANNEDFRDQSSSHRLARSPLPHIAIPSGWWPPSEVTDMVEVGPAGRVGANPILHDSRLAPVAILDRRVLAKPMPGEVAEAVELARTIAACAAVDPDRTLDEKTRALAAVHNLGDDALVEGPSWDSLRVRVAISLAGASHGNVMTCSRCGGGHHQVEASSAELHTPEAACLQRAFAGDGSDNRPNGDR